MTGDNRGFFSLKWIMESGITHYYQAANLTVIPHILDDENRPSDVTGYPAMVRFTDASGVECGIDKGVVYIMNDKGTTVDKINMSIRPLTEADKAEADGVATFDVAPVQAPPAKGRRRN